MSAEGHLVSTIVKSRYREELQPLFSLVLLFYQVYHVGVGFPLKIFPLDSRGKFPIHILITKF